MICPPRASRLAALLLVAGCVEQTEPAQAPAAEDSMGAPIAVRDSRPMPLPFTPPPGAIFAISQRDGYRMLSTLVLADSGGTLSDPPEDRASKDGESFVRAYLAPGARYAAMHGGRHIGWLVVDSATDASCVGIGAEWRWALGPDSLAAVSGLAFAEPQPEARLTRAPTDAEDAVAREAVLALFRQNGLGDEWLAELIWDSIVVVQRPGGLESIVAGAEVLVDSTSEYSEWALVVVEGTRRDPRVTFAAVRGGEGREYGRPSLFDVEDIDGDRIPELVLETLYYEGWAYEILRRYDDEWRVVFAGGGGGC